MRRMNRNIRKSTAMLVLSSFVLAELMSPLRVLAAPASASVEETMYLNLDYYGQISKANVVKGINFNSLRSYTDYGDYTDIINMSTEQKPEKKGDSITWEAPKNGGKFFFQGSLDKDKVVAPWSFDVTYKVNGVVRNATDMAGASGLIEMDIDAYPNKQASQYMQDNFMLIVAVPIDGNKIYSVDAPGSQMATLGQYSGVMFAGLPGKEQHYVIRMGTDSFETVGAVMMMSPGTVSELEDLKDLKELKDKFRNNTNAMLDDVEALMDNVTDMSKQLELNNQMLRELRGGKEKIHSAKDSIFSGNDILIQDLQTLSGELSPLSESLKSTQWMVYELNKNMNAMDKDILDSSAKMRTLSTRLKTLGNSMGGVDNLTAAEINRELATVQDSLSRIKNGILKGTLSSAALSAGLGELSKDGGLMDKNAGMIASASELAVGAAEENPEFKKGIIGKAVGRAQKENVIPPVVLSYAGTILNGTDTAEPSGEEVSLARKKLETSLLAATVLYRQQEAAGHSMTAAELAALAAGADTGSLGALAAAATEKQKQAVSDFVGEVFSVQDIRKSAEALGSMDVSSAKDIAGNLGELTGSLSELSIELAGLTGSTLSEDLLEELERVSRDIEDMADDGAAVSFQTARFLNSARNLAGDMDTLIDTLNSYYPDVQKLLENTDNLVQTLQKSSGDLSSTLKIANDTLRSASDNLDAAADAGLNAGELAVDNAGRMIENTKNLKDSGSELRKSINDELDEKEAENNFLNMDPDAVKLSFTSEKNPEPSSLSIVARTEEISVEDNTVETLDSEQAEAQSTVFHRISQVFVRIWEIITGLFSSED